MVPRSQAMALKPAEFIRRVLLHVLARGFHRIRHYGLFASAARKDNLARAAPASGRTPTNDPRCHRKWRRFGTMAPLPLFSHAPRGPVRFARTSGRHRSILADDRVYAHGTACPARRIEQQQSNPYSQRQK
jgi:hypothetical protein